MIEKTFGELMRNVNRWFGFAGLAMMAASVGLCLRSWHRDAPDKVQFDVQSPELEQDTSPDGRVQFLGPFSNRTIRFHNRDLPSHTFLRVRFDLLILRSWDGSVPIAHADKAPDLGPDYIEASLDGGPTLMYTTFSNRPNDPGFTAESRFQNYPSPVPGDIHEPQTGATERNSMGYNYPWPGAPEAFPMDATYHVEFLIPHQDKQATFNLKAFGLQELLDESWGIRNVSITTVGPTDVPKPSGAAIAEAFAAALTSDSVAQPAAVNTLVCGMDATVDWIDHNVEPVGLDASHVQILIENLGADDSHIPLREDAMTELKNDGPAAEVYLRDARRTLHGETRERIDMILARIGIEPLNDERLRRLALATRVLEIIQTPAARSLRHRLVTVTPHSS